MLPTILNAYGLRPSQAEFLSQNGGFSGALFWRVTDDRGRWCLRCWPAEHPSRGRLESIHRTLLHAGQNGFKLAAIPQATNSGQTFVEAGGRLWELSPWLPGQPHRTTPAPVPRVKNAMKMLAQFHTATACPDTARDSQPEPEPATGLDGRLQRLHDFVTLHASICANLPAQCEEVAAPGRRIAAAFPAAAAQLTPLLQQALQLRVVQQLCLRDVWRDNVLFTGDAVSGLVDFGAMRYGAVAMDIARLLGSLAADDRQARQAGLNSYAQLCPLSGGQRQLVEVFDRCFVVMAGMQWLEWLCLDARKFDNLRAVGQRLCEIADRLERLSNQTTAEW